MSRSTLTIAIASLVALTVAVVLVRDNQKTTSPGILTARGKPTYRVVQVLSGDALTVQGADGPRRVRLVGIDAADRATASGPGERCAAETVTATRQWVRRHRRVELDREPGAPDQDDEGRLLRYVGPPAGGRDLAYVLTLAGLARVAKVDAELAQYQALLDAQARARATQRGIWGSDCRG